MFKKTIFTVVLQVVIIGAFVLIAAGSGSERAVSDSTRSYVRSFAQGYDCGSKGYSYVGAASSESGCARLCENKGYSNSYCYSDESGGCFCK